MAKSETVSTVAKPEDLEKGYLSASKALSVLGIKMTTKKPNAAVIGPMMTKSKKKAEFKLTGDAKLLKLTVECDGNVNTLGMLDVAAEKDAAKRLAITKSLVECGLVDKSALAALEKELSPAKADPKVVANIDRKIEAEKKKIAESQKTNEVYQKADNYDKAIKVPAVLAGLEAAAKAAHTTENLLFLRAAAAKKPKETLIEGFIREGSKFQINIDSSTSKGIIDGSIAMDVAVTEVKMLIQTNELKRVKLASATAHTKLVADAEKIIALLETEKKKLGAG